MRIPAALARARLPSAVLKVLRTLADAGRRSFVVGGAVRDVLLHRPREANDFDIATPATARGFNVLLWRADDLGYALVSDVDGAELRDLAARIVGPPAS